MRFLEIEVIFWHFFFHFDLFRRKFWLMYVFQKNFQENEPLFYCYLSDYLLLIFPDFIQFCLFYNFSSIWLNFGSIPAQFWLNFGSIKAHFWLNFWPNVASILVNFCLIFGSIFVSFLARFCINFNLLTFYILLSSIFRQFLQICAKKGH